VVTGIGVMVGDGSLGAGVGDGAGGGAGAGVGVTIFATTVFVVLQVAAERSAAAARRGMASDSLLMPAAPAYPSYFSTDQ
jgi:hypothetical protein